MLSSEARNAQPLLADHETVADIAPVAMTFRRLQQRGLSAAEAGNLTARLVGLQIVRTAWTTHEIEHVIFLRTLVVEGRLSR
jgi:hypothetical protein